MNDQQRSKMSDGRKKYVSPKLRVFGSIKEVTAGGSGGQPEGAKGSSMGKMKFP